MLIPILDKSKYIITEEGLITFIKRLYRILAVKTRRKFSDSSEDVKKWLTLKDKFKGKRAFLIGNGPSINRLPLHLLKDEYVICFNHFTLMLERLGWKPQFYCITDDRVLTDMVPEINSGIADRFQYCFFPDLHPYNINYKKQINHRENIFWLYLDKLEFSNNLPWAGINKTVANVGLQILAYLGFNPIYIIGVDLSYAAHGNVDQHNKRDLTSKEDNDPNHFDPRYFGKGKAYHTPRMEETYKRFDEGRKFFDSIGVKIFNAGLGGNLNSFERVEFRSLFNQTSEEELKIFLESMNINGKFVTIEEAFPKGRLLTNIEEFNENDDIIITDTDTAINLIQKAVFTHIPRGPVQGKYVFEKRKERII